MMNTSARAMNLTRLLLVPLLLLLVMPLAAAEARSADEVRKRMEASLPALDELRKAGRVGETNKGYLEARVRLSAAEQKLIETENEDRKFIYQILADRANTTLEIIERARAEQIRTRSKAGVWLQSATGQWYQKRP
jgi:uncharacterized protein